MTASLFQAMLEQQLQPNEVTFTSIVSACAGALRCQAAVDILGESAASCIQEPHLQCAISCNNLRAGSRGPRSRPVVRGRSRLEVRQPQVAARGRSFLQGVGSDPFLGLGFASCSFDILEFPSSFRGFANQDGLGFGSCQSASPAVIQPKVLRV